MTPPIYGDLQTLKQMLSINDTARDNLLTLTLTSASRQIDRMCSRRFYLDAAETSRLYTPDRREAWYVSGGSIQVDDFGSTTNLKIEEGFTSWNGIGATSFTDITNDYTLMPDNALALGFPITAVRRAIGTIVDPYIQLRVTAQWGWPYVPDDIIQATYIQAARLYRRKDSPEGVLGNSEWGTVRVARIDPDVDALIGPYRKAGFA